MDKADKQPSCSPDGKSMPLMYICSITKPEKYVAFKRRNVWKREGGAETELMGGGYGGWGKEGDRPPATSLTAEAKKYN